MFRIVTFPKSTLKFGKNIFENITALFNTFQKHLMGYAVC